MSIARTIRMQLRAAVAPSVFLLLFGYFAWSATQGDHGLKAGAQLRGDLVAAEAEQKRAELDLQGWERRIADLRTTRLDVDALDERARRCSACRCPMISWCRSAPSITFPEPPSQPPGRPQGGRLVAGRPAR